MTQQIRLVIVRARTSAVLATGQIDHVINNELGVI